MEQSNHVGPERHDGLSRRTVLGFVGLTGGTLLSGCCSLRSFAGATIADDLPSGLGTALKPKVVKSTVAAKFCVDVHAHFFNASDVPVKGYLEGPVAHDLKEPLRSLAKALAPVADALAGIAPTARREYDELLSLERQLRAVGALDQENTLARRVADHRRMVSQQFFEAVRDTAFADRYNAIQATRRSRKNAADSEEALAPLNSVSLSDAMARGSSPGAPKSFADRQREAVDPYTDGLLAFVGFMLSYRWMNLHTYSQAYSTDPGAFGIDHALGALVDFDRWLDCPPRSGHEDQIRLHQLISRLSGGYMLPLVAYNPWTHIVEGESVLERIRTAVNHRGFVGVKIYPPNGFRPYGNAAKPRVRTAGAPSAQDIDKALKKFWEVCLDLDVPVMAHTGESMGQDDAHDALGGPEGWESLFGEYRDRPAPRVNLGHFGGDSDPNGWTRSLAHLMSRPEGSTLYADLGYWSALRCEEVGENACVAAKKRLTEALRFDTVGKRVMYGSDWLMLSKERNWASYPFDIASATKGLIDPNDLFGMNARSCFAALG